MAWRTAGEQRCRMVSDIRHPPPGPWGALGAKRDQPSFFRLSPMPIRQFAQSAPWYWVTQIATPDAERPRSHSVNVNGLKGGPPASACPSNN